MHIIENNLEVVEYENLLLPISIKIRELIQYKNKRALCHWHDDIEIIKILSGSMNFYINGPYTTNAYMNYEFGAYMEFQLTKEKTKEIETINIDENKNDEIVPPKTGV